MNIEELERVSFTKPAVADGLQDVAAEASNLLGYQKLARAKGSPTSLAYALKKLNIAPLTRTSVEKYKASKEKHGMWSGHKQGIVCLCSIPALFAAVYVISGYASTATFFQGALGALCVVLLIVCLALLIRSLFCFFDKDMRGDRKSVGWRFMQLNGYAGSIPEYVLSKALEIKKEFPEANFAIDQLCEIKDHTPTRREMDPFLVAYVGEHNRYEFNDRVTTAEEIYYIDAWDEEEYERRM